MRLPSRVRERLAALEMQRPATTNESARDRLAARLGAVAARLEPFPADVARGMSVAGLAGAEEGSPRAALRRAVLAAAR